MNKNNMNDTSKIASAINDLKNVKIPVKIDGENKTITKIIPVKGHDNMFFFEVVEKDSIMPEFVIPFKDNYDVCVNAVNDFLNKKTEVKKTTENMNSKTSKKEKTNMTKNNEEMMKELNSEIRAFNKTITSSTTNKEIWNKKVELSKKYGINIIGHYVSEDEYDYLKIVPFKENDVCLYIRTGKRS